MRLADDSTPMEKRDSRWVIWAQFELFVDEIMSIVELYHARLDWFQGRLHKEEADFPKEDIKSIIQTVRHSNSCSRSVSLPDVASRHNQVDELERLQRRLLPVRRVVGHLIELQVLG
jgi:Mg2+ and Co2+ transporter CorA